MGDDISAALQYDCAEYAERDAPNAVTEWLIPLAVVATLGLVTILAIRATLRRL